MCFPAMPKPIQAVSIQGRKPAMPPIAATAHTTIQGGAFQATSARNAANTTRDLQSSLDCSTWDERVPNLWSKKIKEQRHSDCDTRRAPNEMAHKNTDQVS